MFAAIGDSGLLWLILVVIGVLVIIYLMRRL